MYICHYYIYSIINNYVCTVQYMHVLVDVHLPLHVQYNACTCTCTFNYTFCTCKTFLVCVSTIVQYHGVNLHAVLH